MERKVHPKAWTYDNIAAMKKQLQSMGLSLDWSREIATCDPAYYKHQQKMFLDFLKAGLVERKQSKVNWDPVDMTVLANEQVIDGRGWRSGAAGRAARADAVVLQDQRLFGGPARRARQARPLAGKSPADAEELDRPLARACWSASRSIRRPTPSGESELEIFTTRPDTLFGAKFMAIAPDHPLATAAAQKNPKLAAFIDECKHIGTAQAEIDTAEKLGFDTGIKAVHPFDPNWTAAGLRRELHPDGIRHRRDLRLPGARPARPRFRQQIRPRQHAGGLPAGRRIRRPSSSPTPPMTATARMINSRFLDGMTIEQAKEEVAKRLENADARQRARWRSARSTSACATGASRASATGAARSRSSIARSAASCRCRRRTCRCSCRRTSPSTGPAIRSTAIRPGSTSPARNAAAGAARDRHHGHVRRLVVVLRALHRSVDRRPRRPTARWSTNGCRSISTSAASSTRSCICSTRASSPAR